jgi:hypothetical protein
MKVLRFAFVLILFGCSPTEKPEKSLEKNTVKTSMIDSGVVKPDTIAKKKPAHLKDLIIEVYPGNDTVKYSRERLNMAYKLIPEFRNGKMPQSPDISYEARPHTAEFKTEEEREFMSFGCEVCEDDYLLMYAYFLKQHHPGKQAEKHRRKLIAIYRIINSIHGWLAQGGTYFGHQHSRIYAYAEYSVFLRKAYDEYDARDYNYPVTMQKSFFIGFLKQLVMDDEKYDLEVTLSDKRERKLMLIKKINELNALITDHFYLREAQGFNFSQY